VRRSLIPSPGTPGEGKGEGRASCGNNSSSRSAPSQPSPGVPGEGAEIAILPHKSYRFLTMRCPFCHADKDSLKVIDSRACDGDRAIRRRRECLNCKKRFTTYERVEGSVKLTVVKNDGRRVPWDRQKILDGLERACFKRPVAEEDLMKLAEEVEEECFATHDREVPTSAIGHMVAERLRRLDQVAYVRFASVYRQFKTLDELIEAAQSVIDARRFEDPSQGKLFIESPTPKPVVNGEADAKPAKPAKTARPKATKE